MVDVLYETAFRLYPYERVDAQDRIQRHQVVIVGGGPIGMAMALDLGLKGIEAVVLDDHDGVGVGSRAICFAKRTLEIADRLGCADPMVDKGVVWNLGKVYREERQIYDFNLLPEDGHKRPAFINLQQPYFEKFVVERIRGAQADGAPIEIRGQNKVDSIETHDDHVMLTVDTPDGPYTLEADYLIACDGARSPIREMMGLGFEGRVFQDNFLIADVIMDAEFPTERRFWFDPPFHPGKSALLHMQPDNIYRIDLQLDVDADGKVEAREENVIPRIKAIVGDKPFTLDWVSVYKFRCIKLDRFVHGQVIFAGDSAHVVSPFGARGGNGGIQDIDNLGWKLAAVIKGHALPELLGTYDAERGHGAAENILNSARATNFMTPKSSTESLFRDEVLNLAHRLPFARRLINSGRLSAPCSLAGFELLSGGVDGPLSVGEPATDLPLTGQQGESCWLSSLVGGRFALLSIDLEASDGPAGVDLIQVWTDPKQPLASSQMYCDQEGLALKRYGHGICYLLRPDGHVCASFAGMPSISQINAAVDRACGRLSSQEVSQ